MGCTLLKSTPDTTSDGDFRQAPAYIHSKKHTLPSKIFAEWMDKIIKQMEPELQVTFFAFYLFDLLICATPCFCVECV